MALVGIELETIVFESDALTTRPPPCAQPEILSFWVCSAIKNMKFFCNVTVSQNWLD